MNFCDRSIYIRKNFGVTLDKYQIPKHSSLIKFTKNHIFSNTVLDFQSKQSLDIKGKIVLLEGTVSLNYFWLALVIVSRLSIC